MLRELENDMWRAPEKGSNETSCSKDCGSKMVSVGCMLCRHYRAAADVVMAGPSYAYDGL